MATVALAPSVLRKVVVERYRQGQRTVSVWDLADHFGRSLDIDFANRIRALLVETAELVEQDYPCTLVNDYCVRHFAQVPVQTEAEARRCNKFNSGRNAPVGIRRAMSDDLVRSEEHGSLAHLGMGAINAAVQHSANDAHYGISAPQCHERLRAHLQKELPKLPDATPDPVQEDLPAIEEGSQP